MWQIWRIGYRDLVGKNLWERDHLQDLDVDGRAILNSVFRKWNRRDVDWIGKDGGLL
jgi:hypothetical protein